VPIPSNAFQAFDVKGCQARSIASRSGQRIRDLSKPAFFRHSLFFVAPDTRTHYRNRQCLPPAARVCPNQLGCASRRDITNAATIFPIKGCDNGLRSPEAIGSLFRDNRAHFARSIQRNHIEDRAPRSSDLIITLPRHERIAGTVRRVGTRE
jgi:hypothetical protein